jgi:hypothetical protein
MKPKNLVKKVGKTLSAGLIGAIIGIIIFVLYALTIWIPMNADKIGLAIIIMAPVMIILFSIMGIFIGGILGIIIYWTVKLIKKKDKLKVKL